MELDELALWAGSFAAFCARFDDLFERSESRGQARKYLRSLLAPVERKTSWQLAEVAHDTTPDRMQRLLYRVGWDTEAARDRLQQFVIERFGDPEGIGVLDETGIPKKGTGSVGVAKQYCGALGKLENCQWPPCSPTPPPMVMSSWIDSCSCQRHGVGIEPGVCGRRCLRG
jgi:SRSO17 transposase